MTDPIEQMCGWDRMDPAKEERTACYNIARKVAHECGVRAKALHGVDDRLRPATLEVVRAGGFGKECAGAGLVIAGVDSLA